MFTYITGDAERMIIFLLLIIAMLLLSLFAAAGEISALKKRLTNKEQVDRLRRREREFLRNRQ